MKLNTKYLINEVTEDFPIRLTSVTFDTNNVVDISWYQVGIYEVDDYPIIVMYEGMVSVKDENGKKRRYKRWLYKIHVLGSNKTLIQVVAFKNKNQKLIEISSNIYPTTNVFGGCLTIKRLNKINILKERIKIK